LRSIAKKFGNSLVLRPAPNSRCPLCDFQTQSDENLLFGLFEELQPETSAFRECYADSDGLCYSHLIAGLQKNNKEFPSAAKYLVSLTSKRLLQESAEMREYIRKQDWHYRDEVKKEAELTAWKRALIFFTGLPEEQFNHKVDKR
jgi:hypothetical protein